MTCFDCNSYDILYILVFFLFLYSIIKYFCFYNDILRIMSASNLALKDGDVIELMCHPGLERFAQEYDNIRLDKNKIRSNIKYQQISYNEL